MCELVRIKARGSVLSLSVSLDGMLLAAAGESKIVELWCAISRSDLRQSPVGHPHRISHAPHLSSSSPPPPPRSDPCG